MVLLLKQPDLGTAVIMGGVTLILLFVAGANLSYLLLAMLAALPVLYHKIVDTPWRLRTAPYRSMLAQRRVVGYKAHPVLLGEWIYVDIDTKRR